MAVLFHQEGDEVAPGGGRAQGKGRRRAREGPRPADIQRRIPPRQQRLSVRASASHRKALLVSVAACRPRFFLQVGYLVRPSKQVRKALSGWRNACCNGTLD